jgi:hypothetical protein
MDQNDSKQDMGEKGSVNEPKLSPNAGWLERAFGITSTAGKIGCMSPLFVPLLLIGYCSYRSAESNRAAAQAEVVQRAADEAAYQESVRTGKVCEDGPNGLNTSFQMNVMRELKDPDSFEHLGTVLTPAKNGEYDALMRFRSKNSFGGYVVGTAIGKLYVAERGICETRRVQVAG